MKMLYTFLMAALIGFGCATVQVQAPKDPIKMDITMRLDVYQHVVNDIDEIENLVSGTPEKKKLSDILVPPAHAADLNPAVKDAAMRRKERLPQIESLEAAGVLGEDMSALLVVRQASPEAESLAAQENSDRMVIYRSIAEQNGTSVGEVQKLYVQRLQANAPAGTPVQTPGGEWTSK